MDLADSGTDEFDHDLALRELSAQQDALVEIEEALQRIRTGTYGICLESGRPIAAARLRAVPWARFSKAVQERLEREGGVPRSRIQPAASVRATVEEGLAEPLPEDSERNAPEPNEEKLAVVARGAGRRLRKTSGQAPGGAR